MSPWPHIVLLPDLSPQCDSHMGRVQNQIIQDRKAERARKAAVVAALADALSYRRTIEQGFTVARSAVLLKRCAVLCALALLSLHPLSAAVDCRNPQTPQQRVVCANPELINLDQHLSSVYKRALTASSETQRKQLEYDQTSWENSGGGCWERVDCIEKWYADRIGSLLRYTGQIITAAAPSPPDELPARAPYDRSTATAPAEAEAPQPTPQRVAPETALMASPEKSSTEPSAPPPSIDTQPVTTAMGGRQPNQGQDAAPAAARQQEHQTTNLVASSNQRHETPGRNDDSMIWLVILGLFLIVIIALVYFLPTIVAFSRRHRNRWIILAINLVFGATLLGWALALIWALNKVDDPLKGGIKYDFQPHDPIL